MANETKKYYKNKSNSNLLFVLNENEEFSEEDVDNWSEIVKAEYDTRVQIRELKVEIAKTDYIACKLAECDTTEERAAIKSTYVTQLARRGEIRTLINTLEAELD